MTFIRDLKMFFLCRPIKNQYGKIEFMARGLEIMKGSPKKARVVYAKIESDSLQTIANGISKSFNDAGEERFNSEKISNLKKKKSFFSQDLGREKMVKIWSNCT